MRRLAWYLVLGASLVVLLAFITQPVIRVQRIVKIEAFDGRTCTVIDYTADGTSSSVLFYEDEEYDYQDWLSDMRRDGRVYEP